MPKFNSGTKCTGRPGMQSNTTASPKATKLTNFDLQATWVIDVLGLSFTCYPWAFCTTRHWQMSGRLVQELNVCTVVVLSRSYLRISTCCPRRAASRGRGRRGSRRWSWPDAAAWWHSWRSAWTTASYPWHAGSRAGPAETSTPKKKKKWIVVILGRIFHK